ERQIGLGAGYIKAGDRVNLNVFSDEDPWQVMSVSANGEVSDGNMYSKPVFLLEEEVQDASWGDSNEGDSEWLMSGIRDRLDTELLEAEGDLDRAKYASLLMGTTKGVDDNEYAYSSNSVLAGERVYLPSYSEYEEMKESGLLDEDKPLWSRSSGTLSTLYAWLSDHTFAEASEENSYRKAANADLGKNNVVYTYKGELPELDDGELTKVKAESAVSKLVKNVTGSSENDTWNVKLYDDTLNLSYDDVMYKDGEVSVTGLRSDTYLDYESLYGTEDKSSDINNYLNTTGVSVMVTDKPYTEEDSEVLYYASASEALNNGELNFSLDNVAAVQDCVYLVPENETSAGEPVELNLSTMALSNLTALQSVRMSLLGSSGSNVKIYAKAMGNGNGSTLYQEGVGGTVPSLTEVESGGTVTLTATPYRNYKFDGWYTNESFNHSAGTSKTLLLTNVTIEDSYYAKFTRTGYDVTSTVVDDTGGYVTGGGTVAVDGTLTLTAEPSKDYEFGSWSIWASKGSISEEAYSEDGSTITINGGYLHNDVHVSASFTRVSGSYNVILTMFPSIGWVYLADENSNKWTVGSSSVEIHSIDDLTSSPYVVSGFQKNMSKSYTLAYYDSETNKSTYKEIYNENYHYTGCYCSNENNENSYDQWRRIGSDGSGTNDYHDGGIYVTYAYEKLSETEIENLKNAGDDVILINIWQTHDDIGNTTAYRYGVITAAVPKGAGTTAGDMVGLTDFTTTITAYPNEGYMFDHWEWCENTDPMNPGTSYIMQSKENPMQVSPGGIVVYKAVFTKTTYEVRLANTDPENCGTASGTGTYGKNNTAKITALPADGYEFESWTYTTKDGVTHTVTTPTFEIAGVTEDYDLTLHCKRKDYEVTVSVSPLGNDTAGNFNKASITGGSSSAETGSSGTAVTTTVQANGSVALTATPNTTDGYRFKQWVGSDGTVTTQNPLTISGIKDDLTYVAEFEKSSYTITVKSDPVDGGKTEASGDDVTQKDTGVYTVLAGATATLKATENSTYTFSHWTNSAGQKFTSNPLTLSAVYGDDTYTAHYISNSDIKLNLDISPASSGEISYTITTKEGTATSGTASVKEEVSVKARSNVSLTAKAGDGYVFHSWVDEDGRAYTDNPMILTDMIADKTLTAVFTQSYYTLTLKSNPIDGGTVTATGEAVGSLDVGVYSITNGTVPVTLTAAAGTDKTFLYWQNSAGDKFFKEVLVLNTVNGSDTYTAYFSSDKYPIRVMITPGKVDEEEVGVVDFTYTNGGATTTETIHYNDLGSGIRHVDPKSDITLSAKTLYTDKYKFERWDDSTGRSYTNNPLIVTNILAAENYTAVYSPIYSASDYNITVDLAPEGGGKAKLTYDTVANEFKNVKTKYTIPAGTTFLLTAEANDGYEFSYWTDSSGAMYQANPLTIANVRDDGYYTAVFAKADYTLTLKTNPIDGGTVSADGDGLAGKGAGVYSVTDGTKPATLHAVADTGKTFLYWQNSFGDKFFYATLVLSRISASDTYTAYFSASSYPIRVMLTPGTADGEEVGVVDFTYTTGGNVTTDAIKYNDGNRGIRHVDPKTDITLSAKTLYTDKYKFERWDDSTGKSYTNNPLIVTDIMGAENYTAVYTPIYSASDYSITVDLTPEGGGKSKLTYTKEDNTTYDSGFQSVKKRYTIDAGTTFLLTAEASDGYEFSYWTDSNGAMYQANPLTVANVRDDGYYTAVFAKADYTLTLKTNPIDGGTVSAAGDGIAGKGAGVYSVTDGTKSATLTATADPGKTFLYWQNNAGDKFFDATLNLSRISGSDTYTAYFSAASYPIRVILSPEKDGDTQVGVVDVTYMTGGKETPLSIYDDKIIHVDPETNLTLSAKTLYTDKYKFERWDDSSGRSYTSNPLVVTDVMAAENYIAVFTPIYSASDYTVTVDMAPEGSGMTKLTPAYEADGTSYGGTFKSSKTVYPGVKAGSTFQLTAEAKEGYIFSYWTDSSGSIYQANPLTIANISKDGYYTAVFNSTSGGAGIKVIASPASGGKAYEIVNSDDTVTLKAEANPGYRFVSWKRNGRLLSDSPSYTADADTLIDGETYIAYFVIDSSYSVKHEITKYSFYHEKRLVTDPDYKVTRETMQSQAKEQVAKDSTTLYADDTPSPKSYGAYGTAQSYYDELEADKFDPSVLLLEDELYTTDGEIGTTEVAKNTLEEVCADFTEKKFGDRYENEILAAKKVSFKDEEGNASDMGVRTYIWKDTGAVFKDNVYILYTTSDKLPQHDYDWVSATVAHDGSLTFTIDHLEEDALMTVVRVTVE
ncbi:MAG: InlB B-repeat-containing protein, partial [Lachnospiraceae bacterium]|nr:InlB B-repeat-containing protein [Lachnospiraceae bacterium]